MKEYFKLARLRTPSISIALLTASLVSCVLSLGFVETAVSATKPVYPGATRMPLAEQETLYAHLTGLDFSGKKSAVAERALKCGTPIANTNFDSNLMNPLLRTSVQGIFDRALMQATYDSPEGRFKLHFDTTGTNAIKNANIDLSGPLGVGGPDGVPDFINVSGDIFDSAWNIIEGPRGAGSKNLEYPAPPNDGLSISAENPDSLYDVYFVNLGGNFFGATVAADTVLGHFISFPLSRSRASYIILDNDYVEAGYSAVNDYRKKPLDAVRVTVAHEYFHAIHFGIDETEFEFQAGFARKFWFEMSAVSMEEYIYDDINDYYAYLFNSSTSIPFDAPHVSLETFSFSSDFPYAMGIFPIWLTNKFGPEIVRGTWLGCGSPGPDFLGAVDSALTAFTNGEYGFRRAFQEFGAALALSGERAKFAPAGFGFEEGEFYPTIRDTIFKPGVFNRTVDTIVLGPIHSSYPVAPQPFNALQPAPQSNSNSFVFMHDVLSVRDGCFKPLLSVPTALVFAGFERSLSLVAIPKNQFDTAVVISAPFTKLVIDTNLLINEAELDATVQNLVDSFVCYNTVVIDTLNPGALNDGQPDSIYLRVENLAPGVVLPDPARYSDVMLIVTQTSLDPRDYESSAGIAEYPYSYVVQDSSNAIQNVSQPFSVRTPYPNPVLPGNDQVIFEALRDPLVRNSGELTLNVSIFTETGELVRDNLSQASGPAFTQVSVTWDLTNQSGVKVAPGVYIVLQKIVDGSGNLAHSEVTKVLVIR